MKNRYDFAGEFKFIGKGKVLDNETNKEIDSDFTFIANIEDFNNENRENPKLLLSLVTDELNTNWQLVIHDENNSMKQAINNLNLTIEKVEAELGKKNNQASKTLMNTYGKLLHRFERLGFGDNNLDKYESNFQEHDKKLKDIHQSVEKSINHYLDAGEYKEVDNLAEVAERLERSLQTNEHLLYRVEAKRKNKLAEKMLKENENN